MTDHRDIVDVIGRHALHFPGTPAVIDDEGVLSFGALWRSSAEFARSLAPFELQPSDRVGVAFGRDRHYVVNVLGLLRMGCVAIPLNTLLTAPEMAVFLERVRPRLALVADEFAVNMASTDAPVFVGSVTGNDWQWGRSGRGTLGIARDELTPGAGIIIATGGTTGVPKGAIVSRRSLWEWTLAAVYAQQLRREDVELFGAPFFHSTIITGLLSALTVGAAVRIVRRFHIDEVIAAVTRDGVTRLGGAPTMLIRVLDDAKQNPRRWERIRVVQFGSTKSPPGFVEALRDSLGHVELITGYGATEFGPVTRKFGADFDREDAGVGRPLPAVRVSIVDPASGSLTTEAGVEGEIAAWAPWQMDAYASDPAETADVMLGTGEILSGDIGAFDDDGYLHLRGRRKEIIITGGENVFPLEVEAALAEFPGISEVAVYGVDDPYWSERVEVAVVASAGRRPTLQDIRDYCRPRLASFKIPRSLVLLDRMPLTPNMKIDKSALRRNTAAAGEVLENRR